MSRERVRRDAERRGLEVRFVDRGQAGSLEEAAAQLGVEPSRIVKTLVIKRHDGDFLFALVPGDRQISWPKLRSLLGVNRLQMPDADRAFEATGYERGTIVPLGSTTPWPVYADAGISGTVALGAGEHGWSLVTEAEPLLASLGATIADISRSNDSSRDPA